MKSTWSNPEYGIWIHMLFNERLKLIFVINDWIGGMPNVCVCVSLRLISIMWLFERVCCWHNFRNFGSSSLRSNVNFCSKFLEILFWNTLTWKKTSSFKMLKIYSQFTFDVHHTPGHDMQVYGLRFINFDDADSPALRFIYLYRKAIHSY